ncbi:MAG: hypothetical protein ACRD3N_01660 [Terracidiphilus sp.]
MGRWVRLVETALLLLLSAAAGWAQSPNAAVPAESQAVTIAKGCATSRYFNFSLRLPQGMQAQPLPSTAASAPGAAILFIAYRERGVHRDVTIATADDVSGEKDKSAARWMDKLREANGKREGVVEQGEIEPLDVKGQKFSSLTFQEVREDGSVVNEAVYATALRGKIVSFTFGSADAPELDELERSMQTFSPSAAGCSAGK